jgi:hypothetical protein
MLARMRTAILALILSSPSVAVADDECRGVEADTESCSLLWPTRDGRAPATVGAGWANDAFDPAGHTFQETRRGYANQIGQFSGSGLAPMRGNGFYLDVRFHATPHLYAGVDLRAAWGDAPSATFAYAGGPTTTWDSAWLVTMAGVAGARLPLGRVSLRGELVAGMHGASVASTAMDTSASTVAPLVEPRVGVDVWLSPWWTLEATAGANLVDRSERVVGLGLGLHLQAFDGRFH